MLRSWILEFVMMRIREPKLFEPNRNRPVRCRLSTVYYYAEWKSLKDDTRENCLLFATYTMRMAWVQ